MLKKFKVLLFYLLGFPIELFLLTPILLTCVISKRLFSNKNSIFMGMMHINNWTYVAKALRLHGFYVQVIPWLIPNHELNVIPYDINLKKKFPLLYKTFYGQYLLQFWIFIWSLSKFKVFITPFRTRILDKTVWLRFFEIPLLQLAGKKVILNTYGGDVATPRLKNRKDVKYSLNFGYKNDPYYKSFNERAIQRNTRILEKQADCIISAIDHVEYLKRVDYYFHLRCIDTNKIKPNFKTLRKIPTFIHAPNHRILKGTDTIIKVVESLNKKGFKCNLKIIENTPNDKLLEIIKKSDGVIDQLLLGPYARLSIEAMALGKPVFCYLRKDLFKYNPIWKHCPIINVNPETLEDSIIKFLKKSKISRHKIGMESRKYIEKFHCLEVVGKKCSKIIKKVINNETD